MSTKGRVGGLKEEKGRSHSLPSGQRRVVSNPSILDRKKGSVSTSTKVSATNMKKQPSDAMKPLRSLPPSKVTSTRSKPNEKNVTRPSTKITGSTKPKDAAKSRPPLRPKNVANVKENTNASSKKQTKKGLENNVVVSEQNRIISDAPPSSKLDHNIVTNEDDNKTIPVFENILISDCDKQLREDENDDILNNVVEIGTPLCDPIGLSGNQDTPESEIRSQDNVTTDGSVDHEHPNGHDNEINVQDRVNETSEIASDRLLVPDPKFVVDQENEGLEIERVAQDSYIGSKDVEHIESKDQEHEETTQKEPEYEKTDPKEPKQEEETDPKEPEPEEIEPKDEETQVPKEQEHQETKVPVLEPENKETEALEEPDHEETEQKEPEHEETEPKELETKEPEEPEQKEAEEPEKEAKHKETEERKEEEREPKEAEKKEGGAGKMVVKKQEVVAHGKKETAAAYNDVIEETVSKLRRQRKNRVKALVGAFETVISLESDE